MDNQNNNFENINPVPREPDFPPKEQTAQQKNNENQAVFNESAQGAENTFQDFDSAAGSAEFSYSQENPQRAYEDMGADSQTGFQDGCNPTQQNNQYYQQPQYYGGGCTQQSFNNGINNQPQNMYNSPYGQNTQPPYNQSNQHYSRGNPYVQPQNPYGNNQYRSCGYPPNNQPPVPQKNTGLKAFLICLAVVFAICLIVFVGLISYSMGQSVGGNSGNQNNIMPTEYYYGEDDTLEENAHPESDYSDQINSGYNGMELQGQVKDRDSGKYTTEYSYDKASKSVVGVICYADEVTEVSDCTTQGSGIIITQDGYIVTNAHIINNSKTAYAIQVVTSDGKTYDAGVVGVDSRTDLAVLKIDETGLTPADFGKADSVEVGSSVIAIGNPGGLGYQNSITSGVVSAVNRTVPSNTNVKYIQTDAAINPGNSGGPLCNLYGQVIGINTSKIVSEKYEGMGFAIPSETVKTIVDELVTKGYVSGRVKLGIVGIAVSDLDTGYSLPGGILIDSVEEDGPMDGQDVQKNDIITKIDGESVSAFGDVYAILEKHKAGDTVTVEIYRSPYVSGEEKTFEVEVVLAEAEE